PVGRLSSGIRRGVAQVTLTPSDVAGSPLGEPVRRNAPLGGEVPPQTPRYQFRYHFRIYPEN
ncbi:MAG: hypothetical protein LBT01_03950, partial [Spirochaetaceae bacterium]|nr:hypothetical protein [Spirochaetaceae bacterium]